ncbi:DUF1553 domain-containing protein [Granulicella cerasi]|uniref:DUF1553 domain-containing protein n=1 Tax=Granulicella cerasi TaxID=741063 RepID=A0ABW1ZDN6_9BACT|nr:PSD1 and planctomycete cytochrome C domain-containing protein [Granulicella cerasi]
MTFSLVRGGRNRLLPDAVVRSLLLMLVFALSFAVRAQAPAATKSPQGPELFQQKVQPVLQEHCYDCHSAATRSAGGLRVDDRAALLAGGKSGAAIVPGKPDESLLLQRLLTTDTKLRMPKGEDDPLPEYSIAALREWVLQGAPWSEAKSASVVAAPLSDASAKTVAYPRPATPEQLAYFEKKVRPILVNRCYNCHSDAFKEAGGLRVDVGISIFAGGNDGPVIVPGHPEKSLLIDRLKTANLAQRMPQESAEALPAEEIATLEQWVRDGAAWPDETEKLPPTPAKLAALYPKLRAQHWSWQPLTTPTLPEIANNKWSQQPIDRFILSTLDEKHLAPVDDADPATLLRRVSYDLTGLPPTPAQVKAFEKHHTRKDYEVLVDRLLASPQYGERWGRHWLDVARYGESSGPSRNMPYPNAWRYRDYVIAAFNQDEPYDRFLTEQIAGDLMPASTPADHDRLLIATGYLALGPKDVNQRFKARYKMDNVDDEIDTVTRSTMAMTVSCARCHDHKFDPIPTKDYYALAGIFTSTDDYTGLSSRMGGANLDYYDPKHLGLMSNADAFPHASEEHIKQVQTELRETRAKLQAQNKARQEALKLNPSLPPLSKDEQEARTAMQRRAQSLREEVALSNDPGEHGFGIHSMHEGTVADTTVRVRGVEEKHGPTVPRGFLSLVQMKNVPAIPANHSGRLELAAWITSKENPLTARVYVNRVWGNLFGEGLVSTPDNFGVTGGMPSHPELLDYLAHDFVVNGWSTKKLVREIVLSRTYRLGSNAPKEYVAADPSNRYLWRHAPRRLETEEIRDSILLSSGDLDLTHPQGSPAMNLRMIEIRDDGPVVRSVLHAADQSRYRSIYLPLLRDETPRPLEAFDPVSQTLVSGKREDTTVPGQALFMLNSPFVREQSLGLARELIARKGTSDAVRIREAYERVVSRDPKPEEQQRVQAFLLRYASAWTQSQSVPKAATPAAATPPLPLLKTASLESKKAQEIFREDRLGDQEPLEAGAYDVAPVSVNPNSAQEAAWAAFVQSLYGSAAFQFVR